MVYLFPLEYSRKASVRGPGCPYETVRVARRAMTDESDPLQAQYDGIPVPCYTWRADGDGFVLERANRAAHDGFGGQLAPLIGPRLDAVYPERPDSAGDLATSLSE